MKVALDACDLQVIAETDGAAGSGIAHARTVLRADLRHYELGTVGFFPGADRLTMRVYRKPVTEAILAQVDEVTAAGGDRMADMLPDRNAIRDLLGEKDGALFFSVTAKVVTSGEEQTLVAHEDAPAFHAFARNVEALPAPASYQSTTTFGAGESTAETLLTGEVVALPVLRFNLPSEDDAKALVHALHDHARSQGCL